MYHTRRNYAASIFNNYARTALSFATQWIGVSTSEKVKNEGTKDSVYVIQTNWINNQSIEPMS